MSIEYKKDFVDRVKKLFPDDKGLRNHLDNNSDWVGRRLSDAEFVTSPEDILAVFKTGNPSKVLEIAKKAMELKALYAEWCRVYDPR